MKKIIILALCLLGGITSNAQYTSAVPGVTDNAWHSVTLPFYTAGDDTATNTDVIRMGIIMNNKYDVELKVVDTKVSGTVAGTLWVRSSPDGVNWKTLCEGQTLSYKDSITKSNATTTYLFSFTADEVNGKYIEVYDNATGTSVSAPVTTLYYRKSEQH